MWSRINLFLTVSMITLCLGEITVNREDFGDKFIANYICQFYDAVATSNQNECLCRNNGTLILLKNGSINCYYETKSFADCKLKLADANNAIALVLPPADIEFATLQLNSNLTLSDGIPTVHEWWNGSWVYKRSSDLRIIQSKETFIITLSWSSQPSNIPWQNIYAGRLMRLSLNLWRNQNRSTISKECTLLKFKGQEKYVETLVGPTRAATTTTSTTSTAAATSTSLESSVTTTTTISTYISAKVSISIFLFLNSCALT